MRTMFTEGTATTIEQVAMFLSLPKYDLYVNGISKVKILDLLNQPISRDLLTICVGGDNPVTVDLRGLPEVRGFYIKSDCPLKVLCPDNALVAVDAYNSVDAGDSDNVLESSTQIYTDLARYIVGTPTMQPLWGAGRNGPATRLRIYGGLDGKITPPSEPASDYLDYTPDVLNEYVIVGNAPSLEIKPVRDGKAHRTLLHISTQSGIDSDALQTPKALISFETFQYTEDYMVQDFNTIDGDVVRLNIPSGGMQLVLHTSTSSGNYPRTFADFNSSIIIMGGKTGDPAVIMFEDPNVHALVYSYTETTEATHYPTKWGNLIARPGGRLGMEPLMTLTHSGMKVLSWRPNYNELTVYKVTVGSVRTVGLQVGGSNDDPQVPYRTAGITSNCDVLLYEDSNGTIHVYGDILNYGGLQ